MTTKEHLKKIKAKCESLLAIAEKRTPGKWKEHREDGSYFVCTSNVHGVCCEIDKHNAAFIASCADSAEAGWRATIAAVDLCLNSEPSSQLYETIDTLLAAWPEELL